MQQYTLALVVDMYTFGELPDSGDFVVRVFRGTVDKRALGVADFFGATFYYYQWIYEEVGIQFNATFSHNDTREHVHILSLCYTHVLKSRDKLYEVDVIRSLLYLFEPGCELDPWSSRKRPGRNIYVEHFQRVYNELANTSGLTGGDSNRCFLKFLIRYTNYNRTAYETFVDYLGKYLFAEVSVYGYCLGIRETDSGEHKSWLNRAEDGVQRILKQMSDALEIFNEPRPTPTTTVHTTSLPSKMPHESTASGAEWPTSAQYSVQGIGATAAPTSASITLADLKHVVDSVLPSEGITGSMEWAKRADKHQDIAKKIYDELVALSKTHDGVSFQVLVSLLQEKAPNDMQCMDSTSNRHFKSYSSDGVSYFIQYFDTIALSVGLNATWEGIENKNADIVDAVFSSETQNLCKAARDEIVKVVDKEVFGTKDGFSGLAVMRCGREFVWYELGYRYFVVGRSAGPSFTLVSANDGRYNSNCGQIFLFP